MAAGRDHTVLSGLRNALSLDLVLLFVIVLPWSVSGASNSKPKKLGPSKQSVRLNGLVAPSSALVVPSASGIIVLGSAFLGDEFWS